MNAPAPAAFAVDAVAFDLDGTLLDTLGDLVLAVNRLLAEIGLAPLPAETIRDLVGKGMPHLLGKAIGRVRGVDPDAAEAAALLPRYQRHYAEVLGATTRLYPGVRDGLERLAAAGYPLAVVTNKATRFVRPHLELAGIAGHFASVVGGDDAAAKKPDRAPLDLAARQLGVATARLLMVGDSANDVEAARAAGAPVVVVPYGYREGLTVQALAGDGIVDSVAAVADLIGPRPR